MWHKIIFALIFFCLQRSKSTLAGSLTNVNSLIKRSGGFPAPFGPTPFAPFGLGAFDPYPGVPVLPPFGYPFPGPFPSAFAGSNFGAFPALAGGNFGAFPALAGGNLGPLPGSFLGGAHGSLSGPIPGPFASPFPGAYPLPLIAPPPAFPTPYFFPNAPQAAPPPPPAPPSPLAPASTGPVIVSAKTAATLSLASIIHALIAKKFYPPIFPFPVPNPLPYGVPVKVPYPIPGPPPPPRPSPYHLSNIGGNLRRPYETLNATPEELLPETFEKPLTISEYEVPPEISDTHNKLLSKPLIIPLHETLPTNLTNSSDEYNL